MDSELENRRSYCFWWESWFKRHQKAIPNLQPIAKRTRRDTRWWEVNFQDSMQTIDAFLKQHLWHDSLVGVKDKTIYNKNRHERAILDANY